MGLLDQVLGQVLGNLGGGAASPSGRPPANAPSQGGGLNLPGGLGDLLSGNKGKLAMAILALLASRHMSSGAGGYGSILHDILAGGGSQSRGGPDPRSSGYDDADAGRSSGMGGGPDQSWSQGRSGGGGFLNEVGGMLDGAGGGARKQPQSDAAGGGGLGGALGGGMLGGALGGGLGDLIDRFTRGGQGAEVASWVGSGENEAISPHELEASLGPDEIDALSNQTGMDREDLLKQLSGALPQVIDQLTPHGRQPSEDETTHWV